jgi:putative DNA primase/helicase
MDIDTILAARNDAGDGGQATPQIASLAGKRLVVTSESGAGRKFNSAKIKLITGGDMLTARYLHGNPFTFAPQFSLVMSSNYKPALTDTTDEGMRRRLVIVPFTTRISKKDVLLKERLRTEARDAILSWCIDGAIEWWKNGGMGETPETILKAMGAYYEDNDIIGQFINENCEVGEGLRAPAKNLHKEFCWWLDEGRGMSYRTFAEQMENRGFSRHKYASGACFIGLQMKSEFSAN